MRRIAVLIAVFVAALLFAVTPAAAGVKEVIAGAVTGTLDWLLANALGQIVAMILFVVGTFWGGTWWGKKLIAAKAPLKEAVEVAAAIHAARRPGSPGGKELTAEEKDAILKEAEDVLRAFATAFGPGAASAPPGAGVEAYYTQ
jgi:hypothetical protein